MFLTNKFLKVSERCQWLFSHCNIFPISSLPYIKGNSG